MDMEDYTEVMK
jgi:hypothetical protein